MPSELPPGFVLDREPAPTLPQGFQLDRTPAAPPAPTPNLPPMRPYAPRAEVSERASGGFLEPMFDVMQGLIDQILAGAQQTSPVVQSMTGKMNYQKLGDFDPNSELGLQGWFEDPTGKPRYFDTSAMVLLRDPETGSLSVFARSPETDESVLPSLGRVIGVGALTGPVTKLSGLVGRKGAQEFAVNAFRRAGVTPTPADVGGPAAKIVQQAGKSFLPSSGPVTRAMERGISETGARIEELAARYGATTTPKAAGEQLIKGGEAFVSKFRTKTEELYGAVDAKIPESTEVPMTATLKKFAGDPAAAAARSKRGLLNMFDNPELNKKFADPLVRDVATMIVQAGGKLSWNDARMLRTKIGQLLDKPSIISDVDKAQLEALYNALSEDLGSVAKSMGAELEWKRAGNYWAAGRKRIDAALKEVLKPDQSGEAAYAALYKTAGEGAKGSLNKLLAIKRSMGPEEWDEVASTVLRELGKPVASQAGMGETFSPATFLTRYNKLSDGARDALFGGSSSSLRRALDDLAKVAGYQKATEKMRNTSHSATIGNVTALGAGLVVDPMTTIASALGANLMARGMMNPAFVRWVVGAQGANGRQLAARFNQLSQLARFDPSLREFAAALNPQDQASAAPPAGAAIR